jgi:transposase-like protein
MKRSKFSEEKIACILRQVEAGATAIDVCRQHGISDTNILPLEEEV